MITQRSGHTVSTPYAYGICTPLTYGIDIQETKRQRDLETCDGIKEASRIQKGPLALEEVIASSFDFLAGRGRA